MDKPAEFAQKLEWEEKWVEAVLSKTKQLPYRPVIVGSAFGNGGRKDSVGGGSSTSAADFEPGSRADIVQPSTPKSQPLRIKQESSSTSWKDSIFAQKMKDLSEEVRMDGGFILVDSPPVKKEPGTFHRQLSSVASIVDLDLSTPSPAPKRARHDLDDEDGDVHEEE